MRVNECRAVPNQEAKQYVSDLLLLLQVLCRRLYQGSADFEGVYDETTAALWRAC